MAKRIIESGSSAIVYDDSRVSQIAPGMFSAGHWPDARFSGVTHGGRGAVLFVSHQQHDWVIRHYFRGGLVGRVLTDQYLWLGTDRSRSFCEWNLLAEIQSYELPAPVPVAAHCQRIGVCYTADLITETIPDVRSFADLLIAGDADIAQWQAVGRCIAGFHRAGFYHADLNAYNLQLNSSGKVFLLDWDRGRRMAPGSWGAKNLQRLQRSLNKIAQREAIGLVEKDWQALLGGYEEL